jgi:hypothetical protein
MWTSSFAGRSPLAVARANARPCDSPKCNGGGSNRAENLITLCSRCHKFVCEHSGTFAPGQIDTRRDWS